jgi:hypothetical protein
LTHGTPESPTFADHVPSNMQHDPGFHHLVQHHGLDVNHASFKNYVKPDSSDEYAKSFISNWLKSAHNQDHDDPSQEASSTHQQGDSFGHHNIHKWDHSKDADGNKIPGVAKKPPSEYMGAQETADPYALTAANHQEMYGTPSNPKGFHDHIPASLQHSSGFHHLIQHHNLDPNSVSMKTTFDSQKGNEEYAKDFVHNWLSNVHDQKIDDHTQPSGHGYKQGTKMWSHGINKWDHTKDADGKTIPGVHKKAPSEYSAGDGTPASPQEAVPGLHGEMTKQELVDHIANHHPGSYTLGSWGMKDIVTAHESAHQNSDAHTHTHDAKGNVISLASADEQTPKHATDMGSSALHAHLYNDHNSWVNSSKMEDMLAQHEAEHETGKNSYGNQFMHPHVHKEAQGVLATPRDASVGYEGEYLNSGTLPPTTSKDDVIKHLIKHHPNVTAQDYENSGKKYNGGLKAWHEYLHTPEALTQKVGAPDGHTHEEDKPAATTDIPIGVHLVSHHGMSQADVAKMKSSEFIAHHQRLHDEGDDEEIGHSHARPGGPVSPPRSYLTNPEYEGTEHEHTWYHGTHGHYEGAPYNATENWHHNNTWGRFGDGDWNCHPGSHWTSLHGMAKSFGGGRVIHAKLKMKNPKIYNHLNEMGHDAYERLVASGDLKGPSMTHYDSGGTTADRCCNDSLVTYAKGGKRDDGKYGMQRFRDSLRADGHDGIMVRNHADHPEGHWNALPLSPHDVEITEAHCNSYHGDKRSTDSTDFSPPSTWKAPSGERADMPDPSKYPKAHEVDAAAQKEIERRSGALGGNHPDPDRVRNHHVDDTGDGEEYCHHCDTSGHSDDDDEYHSYCGVCENYGHDPEDQHSFCAHCDEYADHDSDNHQDEHGEKPGDFKPEDYCPSCSDYDKDNRDSDDCVSCGKKLPNVHKWVSHGVVNQGMKGADKTGEPEHEPDDGDWTHQALANHLAKDHGSDVSGPQYQSQSVVDGNGWNQDALKAHHAWLHHNPEKAKVRGFATFDHTHKDMPDYKKPEDMTPGELHLHIQTDHSSQHQPTMGSTHEELLTHHKNLHGAYETKPTEDYHDFIAHSHGVTGSYDPAVHPNSAPKDDEQAKQHIEDFHGMSPKPSAVSNHPGWWQAMHEKMHANPDTLGVNSAVLGADHEHTADGMKWSGTPNTDVAPNSNGAKSGYSGSGQWVAGKMLAKHMKQGHGMESYNMHKTGLAGLVKQHILDHTQNPKAGGHDHFEDSGGAQVNYLHDIKGHLAIDHGEEVSDTQHVDGLHEHHANLHAAAVSGNGEVNHDHHVGHDDHTVPDSLNYSKTPGGWNTDSIAEHLADHHGYTAPSGAHNSVLQALHQHWHNHPEHAVEHGHEIDHAHGPYGSKINPDVPMDYVGTDSGSKLIQHINGYHSDISSQIVGGSAYDSEHVQKVHDLHQKAHADGEGLAKFHSHLPDPNKPIVDDPSINDTLAKHLVGKHGWKVDDFAGKTNQDLIQHHVDAHFSLDPDAKKPSHTHSQYGDELSKLHADGGKKAVPPVEPGFYQIDGHLKGSHGLTHDQVMQKAPAPSSEADLQGVHENLHADPNHETDHTHVGGLHSTQEHYRLHDHLDVYHGYSAPMGYHSHDELKEIHAGLHADPTGHNAPAFSGKKSKHHHGEDVDFPKNGVQYDGLDKEHGFQPKEKTEPEPFEKHWEDALMPGEPSMPSSTQHKHFGNMGPVAQTKHLVKHHNWDPIDAASAVNNDTAFASHESDHHVGSNPQMTAHSHDSYDALAGATDTHKHFEDMEAIDKVKHMVHHHGWSTSDAKKGFKDGGLSEDHQFEHDSAAIKTDHEHEPKVGPKVGNFEAMPSATQKYHLKHTHNLPHDVVDKADAAGVSLTHLHNMHHETYEAGVPNHPMDPHTHAEPESPAITTTTVPAHTTTTVPSKTTTTVHKHFGNMSTQQQVDHLTEHHGFSPDTAETHFQNGTLGAVHQQQHDLQDANPKTPMFDQPHTHAPAKKPHPLDSLPTHKDAALDALTFFQMEASR